MKATRDVFILQTGMKPRRFEKVQTSFPVEHNYTECLECYIFTSLQPQLGLYYSSVFIDTEKTKRRSGSIGYLSVTDW